MSEDRFCPSINNCSLHHLFIHESTKKILMMRYCKGDYEKCERRIRAFSEELIEVPLNLLPNGQLLNAKSSEKTRDINTQ